MNEGAPTSLGPTLARAGLLGVYVLLITFSILTLVPFAWMVCAAFKGTGDFFSSLFLPRGDGFLGVAWDRLTLDNFRRLFGELGIGVALLNSIFLASTAAVVGTFGAAMGGYALAKLRFKGRDLIMTGVLMALIIPGPLLLAPGFQVIYQLGLLNSYAALLLPGLAPAFGVFLFRQAMVNAVPDALLESARIDGCGEIRTFFVVALPLVRPMIGAFLMITFLGMWNNFVMPQIIMQSPDRFPLSVAVNNLRSAYSQDYGMIMAGTMVSIAPVLALFMLLQKEFIAGLTSGAVKG